MSYRYLQCGVVWARQRTRMRLREESAALFSSGLTTLHVVHWGSVWRLLYSLFSSSSLVVLCAFLTMVFIPLFSRTITIFLVPLCVLSPSLIYCVCARQIAFSKFLYERANLCFWEGSDESLYFLSIFHGYYGGHCSDLIRSINISEIRRTINRTHLERSSKGKTSVTFGIHCDKVQGVTRA
jgi:hypothetical protein